MFYLNMYWYSWHIYWYIWLVYWYVWYPYWYIGMIFYTYDYCINLILLIQEVVYIKNPWNSLYCHSKSRICIYTWAKGCDMEFRGSSKFSKRFFHHKFQISWILDDTFSIHINFFMRIQWNGSRYLIFGYLWS